MVLRRNLIVILAGRDLLRLFTGDYCLRLYLLGDFRDDFVRRESHHCNIHMLYGLLRSVTITPQSDGVQRTAIVFSGVTGRIYEKYPLLG